MDSIADGLDVVRGPRINSAITMTGGRISVDPQDVTYDGHSSPVIVYRGRVYCLHDNQNSKRGRLHYRDITPEGLDKI